MRIPRAAIPVVSLGLALALALVAAPPTGAANRNFTLYGDAVAGWGATNTTIASPGPPLTVDLEDNVTLTLNATDGTNHNWFVDYNDDSTDDPSEPGTANFRDEQISWNFTADQAGTFSYRCRFHPATMMGTIVIRNATNPPTGTPGDNTAVIIGGVLVILLLGVAVYWVFGRKKKA